MSFIRLLGYNAVIQSPDEVGMKNPVRIQYTEIVRDSSLRSE
ncbi:MAG: hypothetical protein Q8Q94_01750 [bacterium]|nr:hypothetical protein [bacterium]